MSFFWMLSGFQLFFGFLVVLASNQILITESDQIYKELSHEVLNVCSLDYMAGCTILNLSYRLVLFGLLNRYQLIRCVSGKFRDLVMFILM